MGTGDDEKYKLILADPPWSYSNVRTGGSLNSGSSQHYTTMTLDEIKNLSFVKNNVDQNAVCFLWTTTPLAREGFEVLKSWGFSYKTKVTWVKTGKLGMGFWLRGQTEDCLIGVRGDIKPFRSSARNVIIAPRREHSRKPDEIYWIIEPIAEQFDLNPKCELFARGAVRPGWDFWGLEANGKRVD